MKVARRAMFRFGSTFEAVLFAVALLFLQENCSATCTSGVLRMKPFPYEQNSGCFATSYLNVNQIKGLCGVEYKAQVDASNIIRLTPLSRETFNFSYPAGAPNNPMPCKNLNASGLFNAGSTTAATVMLFDEVRGPHSNLTKTAPNQITLSIGVTYGYKSPGPKCRYNYTVVSGCFMGIKAPSPSPPACPPKYYVAAGLSGAKYCAPCRPGTTSTAPNSPSCTPCPAGSDNSNFASTCKKCEPGYYAPKPGTANCEYCSDYDNKWTDRIRCAKCPEGSYVSTTNSAQCQKCKGGAKCCTVNPSADCPACPSNWTPGPTYTSVFALSSGSTPACLASTYALCAPKFNITIDSTCLLTVKPMPRATPEEQYCDWSGTAGIRGKAASATVDMASFPNWGYSDSSLLAGNVTAVSPPYLDFFLPAAKCTLRYRALTAPAAALLGVPPKPCPEGTPGCSYRPPSSAAICPAGKYIEEETDTKPAPCLPCPPGTYSSAPSNKRCTPCPLGQYASGFGNTACRRCPAGRPLTRTNGTAVCQPCDYASVPKGLNKCQACPSSSSKYNYLSDSCLSNQLGSICCAAGNCAGQVACPTPLKPEPVEFGNSGAVLQLLSKNLPQPQCKRALSLLGCLDANAFVGMTLSGAAFQLQPVMQPRCMQGGPDYRYPINLSGGFTSQKRAAATFFAYDPTNFYYQTTNVGYELFSDSSKGTVTLALSNSPDPSSTNTPNATQCTATFQLRAGYAFDLTPPAGAKCPPNAITTVFSGRTFCKFCSAGQYKRASSSTCEPCPTGTYQDVVGATACKACPTGSSCFSGSSNVNRCHNGYYLASPKAATCKPCPVNTYTPKSYTLSGYTSCLPCPKFTAAPEVGSSVCGVPFPK